MKYWKDHASLRMILIALFFAAGLFAVIIGWTMTGKLKGLIWMIVGLILLLTALLVYNQGYTDGRSGR